MTDKSPLPPGMVEPDETAIRLLALEKLIRRLYASMPTDVLTREAGSLQPILTDHNRVHVSEEDLLLRRASEAASEILWDVWMAGQEAQHRRAIFGNPAPISDPAQDG